MAFRLAIKTQIAKPEAKVVPKSAMNPTKSYMRAASTSGWQDHLFSLPKGEFNDRVNQPLPGQTVTVRALPRMMEIKRAIPRPFPRSVQKAARFLQKGEAILLVYLLLNEKCSKGGAIPPKALAASYWLTTTPAGTLHRRRTVSTSHTAWLLLRLLLPFRI